VCSLTPPPPAMNQFCVITYRTGTVIHVTLYLWSCRYRRRFMLLALCPQPSLRQHGDKSQTRRRAAWASLLLAVFCWHRGTFVWAGRRGCRCAQEICSFWHDIDAVGTLEQYFCALIFTGLLCCNNCSVSVSRFGSVSLYFFCGGGGTSLKLEEISLWERREKIS
jgi:hypothetical protein